MYKAFTNSPFFRPRFPVKLFFSEIPECLLNPLGGAFNALDKVFNFVFHKIILVLLIYNKDLCSPVSGDCDMMIILTDQNGFSLREKMFISVFKLNCHFAFNTVDGMALFTPFSRPIVRRILPDSYPELIGPEFFICVIAFFSVML